jgi:hypothetical protein
MAGNPFASMYDLSAPPGRLRSAGDRWKLADNLRDWLEEAGYEYDAGRGWRLARPLPEEASSPFQLADATTSAWVFALLRTADLLDAEVARLEHDMREIRAPVRQWAVLREGGPGQLLREEGECGDDGGAAGFWDQDRVLFTIHAYTELHALYLFAVDFTQRPSSEHPRDVPLPPDYQVHIADLLEYLARDDTGRWDILHATRRLAEIDLERYRLVPCSNCTLNDEELRYSLRGRQQPR